MLCVLLCIDLPLDQEFLFVFLVTDWLLHQQREQAHVMQYPEKCCKREETAGVGVKAGERNFNNTNILRPKQEKSCDDFSSLRNSQCFQGMERPK